MKTLLIPALILLSGCIPEKIVVSAPLQSRLIAQALTPPSIREVAPDAPKPFRFYASSDSGTIKYYMDVPNINNLFNYMDSVNDTIERKNYVIRAYKQHADSMKKSAEAAVTRKE